MKYTIQQVKSALLIALCVVGVGCKKSQNICPAEVRSFQQGTTLCLQKSGRVSRQLPEPDRIAMVGVQELSSVSPISDPSLDLEVVGSIFSDVNSQGTVLWGKYFTDGQFAYASAIRRYIEDKYPHIRCDKAFMFGEMTANSPRYGCSATWKYDVVCIIRGKEDYVIDPRFFSKVVTAKEWMAVHHMHKPITSPKLEIVPGSCFAPRDLFPSAYVVDTSYVYTNVMLDYYRDSVGCAYQSPQLLAVTE